MTASVIRNEKEDGKAILKFSVASFEIVQEFLNMFFLLFGELR